MKNLKTYFTIFTSICLIITLLIFLLNLVPNHYFYDIISILLKSIVQIVSECLILVIERFLSHTTVTAECAQESNKSAAADEISKGLQLAEKKELKQIEEEKQDDQAFYEAFSSAAKLTDDIHHFNSNPSPSIITSHKQIEDSHQLATASVTGLAAGVTAGIGGAPIETAAVIAGIGFAASYACAEISKHEKTAHAELDHIQKENNDD